MTLRTTWRYQRRCLTCGNVFHTSRGRGKWCSTTCKSKAVAAIHAERQKGRSFAKIAPAEVGVDLVHLVVVPLQLAAPGHRDADEQVAVG